MHFQACPGRNSAILARAVPTPSTTSPRPSPRKRGESSSAGSATGYFQAGGQSLPKNDPRLEDVGEKKPFSLKALNSHKLYWRTYLSCFAGPIAQAQELPNFSAFVAIFLGFGRSIIGLTEGMFSIADSFVNQVQRLCHTIISFLFCGATAACGNPDSHELCSSRVVLVSTAFELMNCTKGEAP